MSKNITPHSYKVQPGDRAILMGHKPLFILFTGLSGSGKSTLANGLEQKLVSDGIHTFVLDGDNVRTGLNSDLGFGPEGRKENIRRIGEVGKLFLDAGLVTLAAFVAPYREDRASISKRIGTDQYVEIFVNAGLEVCEARDVKGLYAKARRGEIKNMTGISAPYEAPESPALEITPDLSISDAVMKVYEHILPIIECSNE